jgi:hypothetical protein
MEKGQLQRHVMEQLQPAYSKRYQTMVKAIERELVPLGVRLPQMDREVVGGYFIWLTLPSPLQGRVVAQRAREEENVVVAQVRTGPAAGRWGVLTVIRHTGRYFRGRRFSGVWCLASGRHHVGNVGTQTDRCRSPATATGLVRRSEMTLECALRYVTPRWYAICLMRMAVGGRGDARSGHRAAGEGDSQDAG